MLHFERMRDAIPVFKALGAETRVAVLELLYQEGERNLDYIAKALGLTNSAISLHVAKLEEAGLVEIRSGSGRRGSVKVCRPVYGKLLVDLESAGPREKSYVHEIQVGQFTLSRIHPTCGLATPEGVIGEFDDPRYFAYPQRFQAGALWFGSGFVEYSLPNSLRAGETLAELQVSFEIASEFPGFRDDYPSDIYFSINGVPLGCWISPGDFGSRRGRFNPGWWDSRWNQYGVLKQLTVNGGGTFIDGGTQISTVCLRDLDLGYSSEIRFRFSAPADTRNPGGMTLYGRGFGDHNQGIVVRMIYE